jgi:hypothetical protein
MPVRPIQAHRLLPFRPRASLSLSRNGALARCIVSQYQAESCNRRILAPRACLRCTVKILAAGGLGQLWVRFGSVQCSAAIWEWDKPSFDCRSAVQYFVLATLDVLVSSQNSTSLGKVQNQLIKMFVWRSFFEFFLLSCFLHKARPNC